MRGKLIIFVLVFLFAVTGPVKAEIIYMYGDNSSDYSEKKPRKKRKVQKKRKKPKQPVYYEEEEAPPPKRKPAPKAVRKQADYGEDIDERGLRAPSSRQPSRAKYKTAGEKTRRRVLGEHVFPTTVLFPSPIPSARFGFSQGVLMKNGNYVSMSDNNYDGVIQEDEITRNKYNYAGFSEVFDSGIIFSNFAALDLNARIQLSGGMEKNDFITIQADPQGDLRVGPVFYYKSEKNLLLSFSPRLYYSKGISVSASYGIVGMFNVLSEKLENDPGFWDFYWEAAGEDGNINSIDEWFNLISSTYTQKYMGDAIKGFTQNLMVNKSKIALSPSLGVAYPVTKYLGLQGFLEYQKISNYSGRYEMAE